tara:strand:+ start:91 stop:429 length:339 start_codon:yes stop_codon:yes gene_type:complete
MKNVLALFVAVFVGCASPQVITKDKYYHFAAGATTAVVADKIEMPKVASAFAAGFAKESYDYIRYGVFDTKDLIATTFGGLLVNYVIKLIKNKKHVEINQEILEGHVESSLE